MPRRPSKKSSKADKPRPVKKSNAKLDRWETADDIPLDEEDAFHASRDKILLGGDTYGDDDDGDEDEVFALKGLDRDEGEGYGEDEEDYEEVEGGWTPAATSKPTKKNKKNKGKQKNLDEEDEEDEDEEEETWGSGKTAYYSSNAAQLESDDEEGHELEEQEAKRLQKKALEGIGDDDFGLTDNHEVSLTDDPLEEIGETPNILPSLPKDKRLLLRHLEKTNPEALALARDWDDTAWTLVKTRKRIARLQSTKPDLLGAAMAHLHYQALLTYATILAYYLHLRTSPKYAQRPELLTTHPIMQRLLTLKQSVSTLEDLGFTLSDSEPEFDEDDDESLDLTDGEQNLEGLWQMDSRKGLEPGELDDLLEDAQLSVSFAQPTPKAIKVQSLDDKPPNKKRKLSSTSSKVVTKPVFDLEEPEFISSTKRNRRSQIDAEMGDAYGEATHLQDADAADKSARKKTLRFHTSKIESTSARRQGARNQAMGGDDDIPYRERKREKEARLLQETKNKIQDQGGEDLDDSEPLQRTSEKRRREDESSGESDSDGPDGYYELVKKKGKEKKEQKKAEYEATRAAERGITEEGANEGPRSLTRAILTNKGLTPHRSKSVRNPRVKKRQKYEKAKRKLSSQKAVYKGGLAGSAGRYEGEKSGISKVVKSIKLG